jgi:hypothetical protein
MPGRRWTSEAQVLEEMERLNDLSLQKVAEYESRAVAAAEAEATHKAMRAKRVLLAKASGVRSISEAEYVAEADDDVAQAYLQRLAFAAEADAIKEGLRSIRTNQDGLRTAAASHRSPFVGPG